MPPSSKPRAGLLTPRGAGAIAVIRIAGNGSREILKRVAGSKAQTLQSGTVGLVKVRDDDGQITDEALLVCLNEDLWELHVHGGVAVVDETLRLLAQAGTECMETNSPAAAALAALGAGDVWEAGMGAEVLAALPHALTPTAVRLLSHQAQAGLSKWARHWHDRLTNGDPLWIFQSWAQWILDRSATLQQLLDMPRVAIVGPPNAGKSTLANALLGRPVSITSDVAGTTRDWVDSAATLAPQGTPGPQVAVTLVDTAGIRPTEDPIEKESIARTHQQIAGADAVIAVVDGSIPLSPEIQQWIGQLAKTVPTVLAINKADRANILSPESPQIAPGLPGETPGYSPNNSMTLGNFPYTPISALHHTGLETLVERLLQLLGLADVDNQEIWAFTARQTSLLAQAAEAPAPQEALAALTKLKA